MSDSTKKILFVIAAVLIIGAIIGATRSASGPVIQDSGSAEGQPAAGKMIAAENSTFEWAFSEIAPSAETGIPQTAVTLTINGQAYPVGTHDGSCAKIDGTSWKLLPGEIDGAICWFAGGGTEIGVFDEQGHVVVKKGALDEGNAEVAGSRGTFQTLFTL